MMLHTHGQRLFKQLNVERRSFSPRQIPCYTGVREMDILLQEVEKAVRILRDGGVIAFPTDTVYGLGADAFNFRAVDRIYEIKKRPKHKHLPLLIADASQLSAIADPVPGVGWFLARRFWPGGLTLVLPRGVHLPSYLATGHGIAVRVPNHHIPLAIIQQLGKPLIGTSANISGQSPALTADEVRRQLEGKVDYIINGGKCSGGQESTVVDIIGQEPVILRQGIIPAHKIIQACNEYSELNNEARCYRL